jgi:hypothetical protein
VILLEVPLNCCAPPTLPATGVGIFVLTALFTPTLSAYTLPLVSSSFQYDIIVGGHVVPDAPCCVTVTVLVIPTPIAWIVAVLGVELVFSV